MRVSPTTTAKNRLPATAGPPQACACGRLRRATRALTQLYDDLMAPAGLRVTQFSLLRTLARGGPMRITELATAQLLDRTALSRNLDPLVERGHVDIVQGEDARARDVAITRAGMAALKAAEVHWMRAQQEVARRVGTERLDTLIELLGELESLHPDNASARPYRPLAPAAKVHKGRARKAT